MKKIDIHQDLERILAEDFQGLHSGGGRSHIKGGQTAANQALADLDLRGYAKNRSEVLPKVKRGATVLSPYIRHNLITLPELYEVAGNAPYEDREKFRDELLWQEYARHLYARLGTRLFANLRYEANSDALGNGWEQGLACVDFAVNELESDGWLVNQSRMWLASHWTVRNGKGWQHGQEEMYRHLIDGSRAANLLGWQWTVGSGTGKQYGFARWQVEKRAPELCESCGLKNNCPIQNFLPETQLEAIAPEAVLRSDLNLVETTGPLKPIKKEKPEFVLMTVDSLGDSDPALEANPNLPAVFVFNQNALAKLQLSSKRIFFYLETLQDLAQRRELVIQHGDPYEFAKQHKVAVTFAPVPSFKKFSSPAEVHPFLWLRTPHSGSVKSFSAWRAWRDSNPQPSDP